MQLYLDNRYSEELEKEVISWLSSEFDNIEKEIALDRIFHEYIQPDYTPNARIYKMYKEMAKRLGFPEEKKKPKWTMRRIAAVVLPLLVAVGGFWLWNSDIFKRSDFTEIAEIIVSASGGIHEKVLLPDSTIVWLRSGSSITYPELFADTREVLLSGEAHFTVNKSEKPFIVNSECLKVEVLGTVFNMSAFPDDKNTCVKLYSGSVQASAEDKLVIMEPGHLLTYCSQTTEWSLVEDTSDPADWIAGVLLFEEQSLRDIFRICERHFGICINHDKLPASDLRHSARFDSVHTIEDVMNVLQILTGEFQYTITNDTVNITTYEQ